MAANPMQTQEHLIEQINACGDIFSQYTYLLEMAAQLPRMTDSEKAEASIIEGCQSQVWLSSQRKNGRVFLQADSDTLIVRGLLFIILSIYSGATPNQIAATPFQVLNQTELADTLETSRRNGVAAILKSITDIGAQ